MWAVNNLRLTKLITSTVPATALSTGGSRRCKSAKSGMSREGYSEGSNEFDSIDICKPLSGGERNSDSQNERYVIGGTANRLRAQKVAPNSNWTSAPLAPGLRT